MITIGSVVKCIRGAEGILEEGSKYLVDEVTPEGHLILLDVSPPEGYNCFNKTRFEDTGENIFDEIESFIDWDYILEDENELQTV